MLPSLIVTKQGKSRNERNYKWAKGEKDIRWRLISWSVLYRKEKEKRENSLFKCSTFDGERRWDEKIPPSYFYHPVLFLSLPSSKDKEERFLLKKRIEKNSFVRTMFGSSSYSTKGSFSLIDKKRWVTWLLDSNTAVVYNDENLW